MRSAAAALLVAALAVAPAAAAPPRALPRGKPIAVYAPLAPTVILFGDSVRLDLTVAVDRRRVDPATVALEPRFAPFDVDRPIEPTYRDTGPITLVRFPLVLRCISYPCVPTGQATLRRLRRARIRYALRSSPKHPRVVRLRLPAVEVLSQINPSLLSAEANVPAQVRITPYTAHLLPLPKPTYRTTPAVLVGGAIAGALVLLVAALLLGRSYLRVLRPRSIGRDATASELEVALALLARAQARGDETATRKALERLGAELDGNGVDGDLAATARGLAWAEPAPTADEVRRIAERVRSEAHP